MVYWVSLKPGWKLQDVQAGLNVVIAFICAGCIFVLVRYCWLLAARKVTQQKDVPASSLLSLNTIGETIDVIWLLRKELFTRRYSGLLLQCISVMLLTAAALTSGFIARFSTRYGMITIDRLVNGTIAARTTGSIPYAEVDTNLTLDALRNAKFPQTQLLEYLPNPDVKWEYVQGQWNSSWAMDCSYEDSVNVPNVIATSNCTTVLTEIPQIANNWNDFTGAYNYEYTSWRNNLSMIRDFLVFTHGIEYGKSDPDDEYIWISARIRTVAFHMYGVPYNASVDSSDCRFASGPVASADYTSMTCTLTRSLANRTKDDLTNWGAFPEGYELSTQVSAYMQHYGNNFRKRSSRDLDFVPFTGAELAMFYQAYLITKDTSTSPYTLREISVHIEVAQISIITLMIFSVGACLVLFGMVTYWIFLYRNWSKMNKTPQSKLDWMLRTLRMEGEDHNHSSSMRQKLRDAMASGHHHSDAVPLRDSGSYGQYHDRTRSRSIGSSIATFPTPELDKTDDGFETPMLGATFSPTGRGTSSWFPQVQQPQQRQQYQRVDSTGYTRQSSYGQATEFRGGVSNEYNPVAQSQERYEAGRRPKVWAGTHHVDTIYDPGRW